uniref:Reverse transcriptase domain-containing protein n=1 Tax=Aegilops tauschii subsp. strangulata TaxID=200361 RepID=A0A453HP32_AEGTS
ARAFDCVSWEYLLELMQQLGFPTRWRDWIALLLSTSSSSCQLNGVEGDRIWHRRGLRQGDPLSPLLFILAIDPLQRLFEAATAAGELQLLPVRAAR